MTPRSMLAAIFLILCALGAAIPGSGMAQPTDTVGERVIDPSAVPHPASTDPKYGIAFKRPVLQGACKYCPRGVLADAVKKAMAPYGYDVAVCYSCSGGTVEIRLVAGKLVSPPINPRDAGEGTVFRPEARMDFGVTGMDHVREAYAGVGMFQKFGAFKNLRTIARIQEMASYLMIAATKESGITDLSQIKEKKLPVRLMAANGGVDQVLRYYGITRNDILAWGGTILSGNALTKDPNFDVIIGLGSLANNPENNVWYEMTQKRDLNFFPLPEGLRDQLVKDGHMVKVDLPFRYMRGVGDTPVASLSDIESSVIYGTADLPDQFVRDVAKALDEQRALLKWTSLSYSYDPSMVWDTENVPLHPAAARYYRERKYMK